MSSRGRQPGGSAWKDALASALFQPVSSASLVLFRIVFGVLMAGWALDYLVSGRVTNLYIRPRMHFTYYLFDFVQPWPGQGMYWHFSLLLVLAGCIACGLFYRVTAVLFALGFTYFFLLERTNYQNHYYLLLLISWTLALLPLHRSCSLDVLAELTTPSATLPAWGLWLLRFHVALPYVFGGFAKLHPDWFAGEPLRTHLVATGWAALLAPWVNLEVLVKGLIWGGLVFDLAIVPLLCVRRTRSFAYALCCCFHLINAQLFSIHVFPWFMIVATTVFFCPDWPVALFGGSRLLPVGDFHIAWGTLRRRTRWSVALAGLYVLFHCVWPFRHLARTGDAAWTEQGHYFSWRMMLRAKVSAARFYVTDPATGASFVASLRPYLSFDQMSKFTRDPEMVLQLAHFLAAEHSRRLGHPVQVRALVLTSLNGRKPQLLIDPNVDLAQQPRGFYDRPWIQPQTEPLRKVAWNVPLMEWERHVELPPLHFLKPVTPFGRIDRPARQAEIQPGRPQSQTHRLSPRA